MTWRLRPSSARLPGTLSCGLAVLALLPRIGQPSCYQSCLRQVCPGVPHAYPDHPAGHLASCCKRRSTSVGPPVCRPCPDGLSGKPSGKQFALAHQKNLLSPETPDRKKQLTPATQRPKHPCSDRLQKPFNWNLICGLRNAMQSFCEGSEPKASYTRFTVTKVSLNSGIVAEIRCDRSVSEGAWREY